MLSESLANRGFSLIYWDAKLADASSIIQSVIFKSLTRSILILLPPVNSDQKPASQISISPKLDDIFIREAS